MREQIMLKQEGNILIKWFKYFFWSGELLNSSVGGKQ